MNKVILKGRLTATPELKQTNSGIAVTDFSVAVNRRYNKNETDFINCQAWRGTAEFVTKYFKKGQEVMLVGELHIEKYLKDDETRYATRVVVEDVEFCGSKKDNEQSTSADEADENSGNIDDFVDITGNDGDLPF